MSLSAGPGIGTVVLPPGFTLAAFPEIGSTQDEAKARADAGAPHGLAVFALRQTSGRGRRGRAWESPIGNLSVSYLLRLGLVPAEAARLSFLASLAVLETVESFLPGMTIALKWPNDVMVEDRPDDWRKISGILLESHGGGAHPALILGIGINLAHHPEGTETPATSIAAFAAPPTPEQALERLTARLAHWLDAFAAGGFAAVRAAWTARARGMGQPIRVRLPNQTLHGRFAGLDPQGALILTEADGATRLITAGDVFFG
ncbi:biotin--[acetyl-CoA-carboxylase] ligase [Zavarzinia sp. CC-PAN008]|uniref:biotin--[acetyl-CoA-carboxylase] ligase n=1 Tax=Zavarzinia sp. CC-PAN008 TaxID=3243332 RepID=UPI003F747106